MSKKIDQKDIDIAIANLVLPNFVLEEARNQKKQFDEIIKKYNRKQLFNHYLGESDNAKKDRLFDLQTELTKLNLPQFFTDTNELKKTDSNFCKKIEDTAKKLLNELKKKTAKDIDKVNKQSQSKLDINWEPWKTPEQTISTQDYKSMRKEIIKTLDKLKKIIKDFASPSLFNIRLKKGSELDPIEKTQEIYKLICELQYYYKETINCKVLDRMKIDMYVTLDSIQTNKNYSANGKTVKLGNPMDEPTDISFQRDRRFSKLFVLFTQLSLDYKKQCSSYLNNAFIKYNNYHKQISELKKSTKSQTFNHDIAYITTQSAINQSRSYLKNFKEMNTKIRKFVKENPKYAKFLKKPIDLIKNQNLDSTLKLYERKMKKQIYLIKYGQLEEQPDDPSKTTPAYLQLLDTDMLLDEYVLTITKFIETLNNPESQRSEIENKFEALTHTQAELTKIPQIINSLKSKNITYKKSEEDLYDKLANYNKEITEKMALWEEHYNQLKQILASYEQATSAVTKAKKLIKIAGFLIGLATGSCKINASLGRDGLQLNLLPDGHGTSLL